MKKTKKRKTTYKNRWLAVVLSLLIVGCAFFGYIKPHFLNRSLGADGNYMLGGAPTQPDYPLGDWSITQPANKHQIEGYASSSDVLPGENISFEVSCTDRSFSTDIYRMGWYNGDGASKVAHVGSVTCRKQAGPVADKTTGLITMNWPRTLIINVNKNWSPGYYLVRMTTRSGYQAYVPFLVRSPEAVNNILFIHANATDAAYNDWGGQSLYEGSSPRLRITRRAMEVSLDKPFAINNGAGEFLTWEYPMVKFLDKSGYNVDYASDLDVNNDPSILLKYKTIVIAGHDEYWSLKMYNGYQQAVNRGVNLAIFAANTDYRPTRFETYRKQQKNGIIVCYKAYQLDPHYNKKYTNGKINDVTGYNWWYYPFNRPESTLLGAIYNNSTDTQTDLVVADDQSWVFNGTGLQSGDKIPGLLGYEYDQYAEHMPHPDNVDVLFKSPVYNGEKWVEAAGTYYQAASGGQVFDAGTNSWSWGLDDTLPQYSPAISQITTNVLNKFSN